MPCETFENQILDYLENQLTPAERAKVAAHLGGCAECRAFAQQLQRLDAQLTHAIKSPTLSSAFDAKLRQRLKNAVLPEAKIAERKRQLQAEYEAGLAQLSLFPRLPRKLFELLGLAAALALACWVVWPMVLQSAFETTLAELSKSNRQLVLLSVASAAPIIIGLLLAFPALIKQLCPWRPAGSDFSQVR